MDIKKIANEVIGKITGDKSLLEKFKQDPIAAVKSVIGNIDLPDGALDSIVDAVKAKIGLDKAGDILGSLGGLFGSKK